MSQRNFFKKAAIDLLDPSRLRFVEVSPRTANGCKLFFEAKLKDLAS